MSNWFDIVKHRHLTGSSPFSQAAIDDVIERGRMADWLALREALKHDVKAAKRTIKVCEARVTADPGALRHVFWISYLDPHRRSSIQAPGITPGSLDGIETNVTQLIREAPLETRTVEVGGTEFTTPTDAEALRVRAAAVLKLNAAHDYQDFVALTKQMGAQAAAAAMQAFDAFYPQPSGESALQQFLVQLNAYLPETAQELFLGLPVKLADSL